MVHRNIRIKSLLSRAAFVLSLAVAPSAMAKAICPRPAVMPYEAGIKYRGVREDVTSTVMDPELVAEQAPFRRAVDQPAFAIIRLVDSIRATRDPMQRRALVRCVATHYGALANNRSLLGARTAVDNFYRSWTVGKLAIAYLKVRDLIEREPEAPRIHAWFDANGQDLKRFSESRLKAGQVNNQLFWGGMAVAAVGAVNDDEGMLSFGRQILDVGVDEIDGRGLLPSEMRRGPKALHYHVFALEPLLVTSILARTPLRGRGQDGVRRVIASIIEAMNDPRGSKLANEAGAVQVRDTNESWVYLLKAFVRNRPELYGPLDLRSRGIVPVSHFLGGRIDFLTGMVSPDLTL